MLNGFLLTTPGVKYLKRALFNFKRRTLTSDEERRNFNRESHNTSVCLSSMRPTRAFFKMLQDILNTRLQRFTISNVGIRSSLSSNFGPGYDNPSKRIPEFISTIGLDPYTEYYGPNGLLRGAREVYLKIHNPHLSNNPSHITQIPLEFENLKLSFCIIQLYRTSGGSHASHFVAGIIINGIQYICDSNGFLGMCRFDDVLTDPTYVRFCIEKYGHPFEWNIYRFGFFFKKNMPELTTTIATGVRKRNVTITKNKNAKPSKRIKLTVRKKNAKRSKRIKR